MNFAVEERIRAVGRRLASATAEELDAMLTGEGKSVLASQAATDNSQAYRITLRVERIEE